MTDHGRARVLAAWNQILAEAGRGEESTTTPRDERQENQLDGDRRNASRTTPR